MQETTYNLLVLVFPVLVPLALAALTAVLWRNHGLQRIVSVIGLGAILGCSALLMMAVLRYDILAVEFGSWPVPFGISFVADRLAAALVAITGVLALCVGIFSLRDMRQLHIRGGFYPLFFGMIAGVNGAFLTGDVFNLYVWFEVMLITSIGLLALGRTRAQIDGAIKYLLLNLLGTVLFLMAVGLLYGAAGTLAFADLARVLPTLEASPGLVGAAILFLCAFGIKAGVFPLFFWLPASYHTAPFTISAIFAGLLTKVGVYAAFRVFTLLFTVEEAGIREIVAVVAACTMVTGVFGAAVQWNIRRILSFHIISQIGYMLMGLAIATPLALAGAVFYIVHHIIVKANLFLLAGAIRQASGSDDLKKSGGLLKSHPWLAVLFLIPALSLAGLPPLSGFWAKFLVVDASFKGDMAWLAAVALFTGILTLYSMTKIWMEAFWKAPAQERVRARRVPLAMTAPIAVLCAITLFIGLSAEPFVQFAEKASVTLADPDVYVAAFFGTETEVVDLAIERSEQ
ncbi:Na+/H+ antiporter subunit D [Stappia stellulata]|uniref:Na+/H+ antiporter subunit D n=1 Tax=Stappia stellulata TaxID=71235 RepID=UPI001CD4CC31|nr:Na+/H+ antiporter subunit D [Stappia stellulata]MCA1242060.1 Na+/H+ antiporter subunit D [Stappia stellulata]